MIIIIIIKKMDSRRNISIYIPKAVGAKEYSYDED